LALQFHLDVRRDNIEEWVQSGSSELVKAPYIQTAEQMPAQDNQFVIIEKYMRQIMDNLEAGSR
jgi:hypothetical protein